MGVLGLWYGQEQRIPKGSRAIATVSRIKTPV